MKKSSTEAGNFWKLSDWTGPEEKKIPVFSQSPEKPGFIEQYGKSGHVTFGINAEEHKFFFKLNKKNKKNLSILEVLAGVPWNVYFPEYSSYSELVYSLKKDEVVGTISTGLQELYEPFECSDFPPDEKLLEHKLYVRKSQDEKLEYRVKYPRPDTVQHDFIANKEIARYFEDRKKEAPSPEAPDYIGKSFKAILATTAKRKHTEPSDTLQRDCKFSSDKTDYYSLAGVMVYSHTNCEDDLHRENIMVIHKNNKDHYYRIDFDMSYQSLTEKFIGGIIGIVGNIRSALFPRPQQLAEIKITPESFTTFPIGVTNLHFWPGVRRPIVGGKTWQDTIRSFLGTRASDKGWDEANNSDKNLTKQFTDLAYHPEFIKWKAYHYARYITTPSSVIEKEMESKITRIRQVRIDQQDQVAQLQKQRDKLAEQKGTAPAQLKVIDNHITKAKAELEISYQDETAANHIKFRLSKEDSLRRHEFKQQLNKIPEFKKTLQDHKDEFLKKMEEDHLAFKSKYGSNHPELDQRFEEQKEQFNKLIEGSASQDLQDKQKIYKEDEFTAQLSAEKDLKKVALIINEKRAERRKNSRLFTQAENDHFEKVAETAATQLLLSDYTQKIDSAKTIPEIQKYLKEAKHKFSGNTQAISQIEKLAQTRKDTLQSKASNELQKHSEVIKFLKYAGGAVAVLLLAKVMLPPTAFHAVRVLGIDLLRNLYAHTGSVAGTLSVLTASTAFGIGFFRNRAANLPLKELNNVFEKVLKICKASEENLPNTNHPSGLINALICNIKSGKSPSAKALKEEFGISEDDNNLLINQLTELSRALSTSTPTQEPAAEQTPARMSSSSS